MSLCFCDYVSAMALCYAVQIDDINVDINFLFCICVTSPLCHYVCQCEPGLTKPQPVHPPYNVNY